MRFRGPSATPPPDAWRLRRPGAAAGAALLALLACAPAGSETFEEARARMVREQIAARDVEAPRVLEAMGRVPRHAFVPEALRQRAYADRPLPIGHDQTISQPYVVAFMTEALELEPGERVLEVGTGSGYQAAVLAEITDRVYSIEIVPELAERARATLVRLGYDEVALRTGDGYRGWPEHAPYDAIVVTAAADHVPAPLVEQLAVGGRLVMPVGDFFQTLLRLTKTPEGVRREELQAVRFVPMTGEAERGSAP